MIIENVQIKCLIEEFNRVISNSENIAIFTRDIDLQKEEKETLNAFIQKSETIKKSNANNYSELELNLILCMIMSAKALLNEMSMLISLKEGNMDAAWSHLIYAQNNTSIVARNHPLHNGDHFKAYLARLDAYEKVIFPKMMYLSTGSIIRETKCSICKYDYDECDHIKGEMYNGKLCLREIHGFELEEVSIVERSADKRCRVTTIQRNGKNVDVLTLKESNTGCTQKIESDIEPLP